MKRVVIGLALTAGLAFSVAAFASVGHSPAQGVRMSAAEREAALQDLDRMAKPQRPGYTQVADDDVEGSCWYKVVGPFPAQCELGLQSTCQSGMTVREIFIAGGNCDSSENPFGG
jgi:hypothetical protein